MSLIDSEKQFVDSVYSFLQGCDSPRVAYKRVNLATKRFEEVWKVWWTRELPPKLEVDFILAFEDLQREIDEALLVGIEVKYFKPNHKSRIRSNFYEGLQQALAYALFGFDGISLWHVFHNSLSNETVRSYSQATKRMIDEFRLPVFYLATRLATEGDGIGLECFAPTFITEPIELDYIVRWIRHYFTNKENRNPMREDREIGRRRSTIKTLLRIPV